MSFSSRLKDELTSVRTQSGEDCAVLLCALTHTCASLKLGGGGISVEYVTENKKTAELIEKLAGELYRLSISCTQRRQEGLRSESYVVSASGDGCLTLLKDFGCIPDGENEEYLPGEVPHTYIVGERATRCFIRGTFLGAGSMSDPNKGYHLEVVCRHERFANIICEMLATFDIRARVSERKGKGCYIAYLKEGESISDFLRLTGAVDSMLEYENVRIMRYMANDTNRRNNFDWANLDKTARASAQQRIDIMLIAQTLGLDSLPSPLRDVAEARLNNPEATLTALAQELNIGKSGVNHRLARLSAIAEDIRLHGATASSKAMRKEHE